MEEVTIQQITQRSVKGVFAFVSRSFTLQVISFIRDVILTILLLPSAYGIFFIVESFIAMLTYFSDIGLAGALIQKKEPITDVELQTSFIIQQSLVLTLVALVFIFSSHITHFFGLQDEGQFLLQAFAIALFLSSLKTIPSVILERNLEFGKFVIPQIVETIFYSVVVIFCALKGYGVMSFAYAVLARGLSGVIAMYIICPWKIGFNFSMSAARNLLSYGVPLQTNSLLALVKDNLLILFLGSVLPLSQVGYIGFAQKWAFTPLRLVMDNIIRVTFASFSRLQHDKEALGKAFEKSLFAGTSLTFPSLIGLAILAPYLILNIPEYQKWQPAYIPLVFFCVNAAFAALLVPLTNLLNAIGRIKTTLIIMVVSTIGIWVMTPISISFFGYESVAVVSAMVNFIAIPVIFVGKKYVKFQVIKSIKYPFVASVTMGVFLLIISPYVVKTLPTALLVMVLGAAFYFTMLFFLAKKELLSDFAYIKASMLKK